MSLVVCRAPAPRPFPIGTGVVRRSHFCAWMLRTQGPGREREGLTLKSHSITGPCSRREIVTLKCAKEQKKAGVWERGGCSVGREGHYGARSLTTHN